MWLQKNIGQEKFLKWLNLNLRIILDFTTTDMKGMKHKIKSWSSECWSYRPLNLNKLPPREGFSCQNGQDSLQARYGEAKNHERSQPFSVSTTSQELFLVSCSGPLLLRSDSLAQVLHEVVVGLSECSTTFLHIPWHVWHVLSSTCRSKIKGNHANPLLALFTKVHDCHAACANYLAKFRNSWNSSILFHYVSYESCKSACHLPS